jgi:hypothetical protein
MKLVEVRIVGEIVQRDRLVEPFAQALHRASDRTRVTVPTVTDARQSVDGFGDGNFE